MLMAGKQKENASNDGDLNNMPMLEPPPPRNDGAVGGQDVNEGSMPNVPDANVASKFFNICTKHLCPL